jgi:hypothetical protein
MPITVTIYDGVEKDSMHRLHTFNEVFSESTTIQKLKQTFMKEYYQSSKSIQHLVVPV